MDKACSVEPNVRDMLHLKSHWPSRRRDASTSTALPGSRKTHASLSFPRSTMAGSIRPAQKGDMRDLLRPENHRRAAGWKRRFPLERRVGQKGKEKDRKGDRQRIYNREEKGDTMRYGSVLAALGRRLLWRYSTERQRLMQQGKRQI